MSYFTQGLGEVIDLTIVTSGEPVHILGGSGANTTWSDNLTGGGTYTPIYSTDGNSNNWINIFPNPLTKDPNKTYMSLFQTGTSTGTFIDNLLTEIPFIASSTKYYVLKVISGASKVTSVALEEAVSEQATVLSMGFGGAAIAATTAVDIPWLVEIQKSQKITINTSTKTIKSSSATISFSVIWQATIGIDS